MSGKFRHAAALSVGILVASLLTVLPAGANEDRHRHGQWSDVLDWPFIPIHASIDQDGNVLTYGGKGGGNLNDEFNLDVWNPSTGEHQTTSHDLGINLFCSFAVSSSDGNGSVLLGGTLSGARGLPDFAARYKDGELTDFPSMHHARWYGTGTTLPDGRILMQGGTPLADDSDNAIDTAEVYSDADGWVELTGTTPSGVWAIDGWWYPKSFVTPAGKVWNLADQDMFYLDPDGVGSVDMISIYNERANIGGTSSAVNYAPGKVLLIGASKATIFDLNYEPPRVIEAAPMNLARLFGNAMVLPDGKVLVTGGSQHHNQERDVAYSAEIWDPDTNTWTLMSESQVPRLYHSTALLMPDGRVFTGGGGAPGPTDQLNAEIFSPPYLFGVDGDAAVRPSFTGSPGSLGYGDVFTARSDSTVARVTMLRVGHNTHAMSTQNFLELGFSQTGDDLRIQAPEQATLATPGEYMVFALDAAGVPSEAQLVHISGEPTKGPIPALANPDSAETIHAWAPSPAQPAPAAPPVASVPPKQPVVPGRRETLCGGLVATIVGTSGDDELRGTAGPDVIAGLQGNDVIFGLGGDDVLCGGRGNDVLHGGQGFDTLYGAQGHDTLHAVNVDGRVDTKGSRMFGGLGNDAIFGSNRWDRVQGGDGRDLIATYEGRDWIRGGAGNDRITGGGSPDTIHAGTGSDRVIVTQGDRVRGGLGDDVCENADAAESAWSCERP